MAKYDPLRDYLRASASPRVLLSFSQIAEMVGGLPESAYKHQAYWANSVEPMTHVWKAAWMAAGYRIDSYDLGAKCVTFVRVR